MGKHTHSGVTTNLVDMKKGTLLVLCIECEANTRYMKHGFKQAVCSRNLIGSEETLWKFFFANCSLDFWPVFFFWAGFYGAATPSYECHVEIPGAGNICLPWHHVSCGKLCYETIIRIQ